MLSPKPDQPLISVVIPHLNQHAALIACLDTLRAQSIERSSFEIIVVDNGSNSDLSGVMAQFPEVTFLEEPQPGPGAARNCGIKASTGNIIAFIDADCRAHPDWLKNAVFNLERSPDQTILGGDVRIWRDPDKPITAVEAYESVFAYRFQLYIEQHGFCGTGNMVVRRSDFLAIGPFRGIDVAEDIEWGQRARAKGYIFCYAPEVIVFHPARDSVRELFVKWDRHIQHAFNAASEQAVRRLSWILRALALLLSPLLDWTKVLTSNRIHGPLARIKATYVLALVRAYRAYRMLRVLATSKGILWNRDSEIVQAKLKDSAR